MSKESKVVRYAGKTWTLMNLDTHETVDESFLPTFVKVTMTAIRKVSKAERRKRWADYLKRIKERNRYE